MLLELVGNVCRMQLFLPVSGVFRHNTRLFIEVSGCFSAFAVMLGAGLGMIGSDGKKLQYKGQKKVWRLTHFNLRDPQPVVVRGSWFKPWIQSLVQ